MGEGEYQIQRKAERGSEADGDGTSHESKNPSARDCSEIFMRPEAIVQSYRKEERPSTRLRCGVSRRMRSGLSTPRFVPLDRNEFLLRHFPFVISHKTFFFFFSPSVFSIAQHFFFCLVGAANVRRQCFCSPMLVSFRRGRGHPRVKDFGG